MTTPSIIASYTGTSGSQTIISVPSVVTGDWLVAVQGTEYTVNTDLVAPTGNGTGAWTEIGTLSGTNTKMRAWYKVTTSSGTHTVEMTQGSNTYGNDVVVVHLRNAASITGTPTANAGATGTSWSAPTLTPGTSDALLFWCGLGVQFTGTLTITPPSGMTERGEIGSAAGYDALEVSTLALTSNAATGTKTGTANISSEWATKMFAIAGAIPVRSGSVTATMALAASSAGFKKAVRSVSASAVALSASPSGFKRGVAAPTAPMTLSATLSPSGGKYKTGSVSAPIALGASVMGRRPVLVSASPMTLNATRISNKIGVGNVSTSPVSLTGAVNSVFKRGLGAPVATLMLGATLSSTLKTGGQPIPVTRPPLPPLTQPLRLIAQRILTKEFLDWDLPVNDVEISYALSGPGLIRGSFKPEIKSIKDLNLDAWATYIHAEIDGQIRATGILMPIDYAEEQLSFEAVGFTTYGYGTPWLGSEYAGIQVDPLDVVRLMWQHLQSYPESHLGITVDPTISPVRLGEAAYTTNDLDQDGNLQYDDITDANGNVTGTKIRTKDVEAKPYTLMWWDLVDIGQEIDNLAKATPFDYYEKAVWNANKTDVVLGLGIGYPRKGSKRFDLRFVQDENILDVVPVKEGENTYASAVIIIGAGEGRDAVRGYTGERYQQRLRRVSATSQKNIKTVDAANALAKVELLARRGKMLEFAQISVDANHPNARFGEYQTGDDIYVQVDVPWVGDIGLWHRITTITYVPDRDLVNIVLARSDSFRYGSTI